jgi:hypothetical protein
MKVYTAQVSKILDKHTLIATAATDEALRHFNPGNEVLVLGIGGVVADGIPLVVPKARLRVSENAGLYVVLYYEGEFEEREVEVPPDLIKNLFAFQSRTEKRRIRSNQGLNVREGDMTGNPGAQPIRPGDVVIYSGDFDSYVRGLAEEAKAKAKEP